MYLVIYLIILLICVLFVYFCFKLMIYNIYILYLIQQQNYRLLNLIAQCTCLGCPLKPLFLRIFYLISQCNKNQLTGICTKVILLLTCCQFVVDNKMTTSNNKLTFVNIPVNDLTCFLHFGHFFMNIQIPKSPCNRISSKASQNFLNHQSLALLDFVSRKFAFNNMVIQIRLKSFKEQKSNIT